MRRLAANNRALHTHVASSLASLAPHQEDGMPPRDGFGLSTPARIKLGAPEAYDGAQEVWGGRDLVW